MCKRPNRHIQRKLRQCIVKKDELSSFLFPSSTFSYSSSSPHTSAQPFFLHWKIRVHSFSNFSILGKTRGKALLIVIHFITCYTCLITCMTEFLQYIHFNLKEEAFKHVFSCPIYIWGFKQCVLCL